MRTLLARWVTPMTSDRVLSATSHKPSVGTGGPQDRVTPQQLPIWQRYIATPVKPDSRFNGGNEPPACAMATPLSMLATAINTALAHERIRRMRSAYTDE